MINIIQRKWINMTGWLAIVNSISISSLLSTNIMKPFYRLMEGKAAGLNIYLDFSL